MADLNIPGQRTFEGPATAWKRVLAFMIDFIIIDLVLFWPFESIIRDLLPVGSGISAVESMVSSSPEMMAGLTIISVLLGIIAILYFTAMEYVLGQTPGKMVLGLYVKDLSGGKPKKGIEKWQALVRSIIWIPVFPFIILWVLDPVYALFNQQNQRLFESISRTSTLELHTGA
ncbi:MAG: RDD family protein [Candidatus Woesearchaeota archaeon]